MADPTHQLSYLNYLHGLDRLYNFYFYERFLVPRIEYNDYCQWASRQLESCRFSHNVVDVTYDTNLEVFRIKAEEKDGHVCLVNAKNISVGVGTKPFHPQWSRRLNDTRILHSSQFSAHLEQLKTAHHLTIVGSGQSAAECVLTLYRALTPAMIEEGYSIHWITSAQGFFPMEYSKLGLQYFTPEYMDYFQTIPREERKKLTEKQGLLYKGISATTIADIFDLLYEKTIGGAESGLTLIADCEVCDLSADGRNTDIELVLKNKRTGVTEKLSTDSVIYATGYYHDWPEWFEKLKIDVLDVDESGFAIVDEKFTARRKDKGVGKIFIQNAEIFQHGVGTPDLGLGPYRNLTIVNELLGCEQYRVPKNTAFQKFGIPK